LYLNDLPAAQIVSLINLSSKFYSRIFVGCFSFFKRFKQSIIIVQGVNSLSLRYSIYKVQAFAFAGSFDLTANFYMLAHLNQLVKNFFQILSFFKMWKLCSRR